jgi:phosphoenolpyruvate carboxykinase (GTP)
MTTTLPALKEWVDQVAELTQPDSIHWCNGGSAEYHRLIAEMIEDGTLSALNGTCRTPMTLPASST